MNFEFTVLYQDRVKHSLHCP